MNRDEIKRVIDELRAGARGIRVYKDGAEVGVVFSWDSKHATAVAGDWSGNITYSAKALSAFFERVGATSYEFADISEVAGQVFHAPRKIETQHHAPMVYRVYDELKNHVGEANAISARDLSAKFGFSTRTLRHYIQTIRRSYVLEKYIASTDKGYFVCTADEYERVSERLRNQARSMFKTASENDKKAEKDGQCKIPCGEYYKDCFSAFGTAEEK